MHEKGSPVQRLGTPMLAAIDTATISNFVKDNPAQAYGIAGAVILILILLLISRRRRAKDDAGEAEAPEAKASEKPGEPDEEEKAEEPEEEEKAEEPEEEEKAE